MAVSQAKARLPNTELITASRAPSENHVTTARECVHDDRMRTLLLSILHSFEHTPVPRRPHVERERSPRAGNVDPHHQLPVAESRPRGNFAVPFGRFRRQGAFASALPCGDLFEICGARSLESECNGSRMWEVRDS
jgi:hypothetical protein